MVALMDRWPLVGRGTEMAELRGLLKRRSSAGIVLAGPAGVGKSRLAAEVLRLAEAEGLTTARVMATASAKELPFGALAGVLGTVGVSLDRGDAVASAVTALRGLGRGSLAIGVDDAHALDPASATVIQQLAVTGGARVVMTVRTDEPVPDAILSLWKDGHVDRVDITPLSRESTAALLEAVLGVPVEGSTVLEFFNASAGNCLYLRELVIAAERDRILSIAGGVGRLTKRLSTTGRLAELIAVRLRDLSPEARDALELLAFGEPLSVGVLAAVADLRLVQQLETIGLVSVDAAGEVRIAHPLYAEALRSQASALAQVTISRRLVELVEEHGETDPVRLAVWRLNGRMGADVPLLNEAAQRSFFAHDHELTERLSLAAIAGGGGSPARLMLTEALSALGRHEDAIATAEGLASDPEIDIRGAAGLLRADRLFFGLGRLEEAEAVVADLAATLPPSEWRDEAVAQHATYAMMNGRFREAVALAEPFLARGQGRVFVAAATVCAPSYAVMGRGLDAIELAAVGAEARRTLIDSRVLDDNGVLVIAQIIGLAESGQVAEAAALAEAGYEHVLRARNAIGQAWFAMQRGTVAFHTGQALTAARWNAEAANLFGARQHYGHQRWCHAGRAMALGMAGDAEGAAAAIAALDASPESPMRMVEPEEHRARAWASFAEGRPLDARQHLLDAIAMAQDRGTASYESTAWHDMARMDPARAREALAGLEALAAVVQGPLVQTRRAFAAALADDDGARLDAASADFEAAGCLLTAAESAAAAAAAHRRKGDQRAGQASARRADGLAEACEGVRTPLLRGAGPVVPLTEREREVAALARNGLSSREIGDRLSLSHRTVENHLQRVYTKLGVSNRDGLAREF